MPEKLWVPFKLGMSADQCLKIAKRKRYKRVARNEIVDFDEGRLVMEWYFDRCTLEIAFDFNEMAYVVRTIAPPLITGVWFTTADAALKPEEVRSRLMILESINEEQLDKQPPPPTPPSQ